MKIRIFRRLIDGVFHIRIQTEDWSESDRGLMVKYGEPEINLGGTFSAVPNDSSESSSSEVSVTLDDIYARIMTESPFTQKFDSRDLGSVQNANVISNAWQTTVEGRIVQKLQDLRAKGSFINTEIVSEY